MQQKGKRMPQKFKIRIFMGDKEVTHEELKNYVIKNKTIDRIVNSIADRAIVINERGEAIDVARCDTKDN